MTSRPPADPTRAAVLGWLLDGDPAIRIRWQALRDLTGAPAADVSATRSRVAVEGVGARLLASQRPDGNWGEPPYWRPNLFTMLYLRDLGIDPASGPARRAAALLRERVTWGEEFGDLQFFEGEVEPCINGNVLAVGSYFGEPSDRLAERLLGEQLADGGWNCEAERGSVRSSFHTTICVLGGLLEYEKAAGASGQVARARARAEEYLLERGLFRRLSTGEVIDPKFAEFSFPTIWRFDVLRGLEYLRNAGIPPGERMAEAAALVAGARRTDGRWLLGEPHRDSIYRDVEDGAGRPSRWITLRARRVLDWYRGPWIGTGSPCRPPSSETP